MQCQPPAGPPQFGLRFLFALVAVVATLFGTWRLMMPVLLTESGWQYVAFVWAAVPTLLPFVVLSVHEDRSWRMQLRAWCASGASVPVIVFLWMTAWPVVFFPYLFAMAVWIPLSLTAMWRRMGPLTIAAALVGAAWWGCVAATIMVLVVEYTSASSPGVQS